MDNYYFHMDNLSVGYNRKALIHDICIGIKKGVLTTRICCPLPFGICLPVWL